MATSCPSTHPRSRRPSRSCARKPALLAGVPVNMTPIRLSADVCCASTTASGAKIETMDTAMAAITFICRSLLLGLCDKLLGGLLQQSHGFNVRNRSIAHPRNTELREFVVRRHPFHHHHVHRESRFHGNATDFGGLG